MRANSIENKVKSFLESSVLFTTTIPIRRISFQLFTLFFDINIGICVIRCHGELKRSKFVKKIKMINVNDQKQLMLGRQLLFEHL